MKIKNDEVLVCYLYSVGSDAETYLGLKDNDSDRYYLLKTQTYAQVPLLVNGTDLNNDLWVDFEPGGYGDLATKIAKKQFGKDVLVHIVEFGIRLKRKTVDIVPEGL